MSQQLWGYLTAPVTLQVWDNGMPAKSVSATRHIAIVSPCTSEEYHCPSLSPVCGSASCAVRVTLRALVRQGPTVTLTGQALAAAQLATGGNETTSQNELVVPAVCGVVPMVSFAACGATTLESGTACGLLLGDSEEALTAASATQRSACTDLQACTYACSYASALEGRCPVGRHAFRVAAINSESTLSEWQPITVRCLSHCEALLNQCVSAAIWLPHLSSWK